MVTGGLNECIKIERKEETAQMINIQPVGWDGWGLAVGLVCELKIKMFR